MPSLVADVARPEQTEEPETRSLDRPRGVTSLVAYDVADGLHLKGRANVSAVIRAKAQAEVRMASVSARIWRRCSRQRPLVGPMLPMGMLRSSAISL